MKIKQNIKDALNWKNIRLNLLICAGITILLTFISWQQAQSHFLKILFVTFIYANSIGFSIYFFMIIIDFEMKNRWLKHLSSLLQICVGTALGVILANLVFLVIYGSEALQINFTSLGYLLFSGIFFATVAISIFYFFHLSEERKYRQLQEEEKKTKAELRALVAQINPHFLFNTLNSISSLIHLDPDQADEMIQKLSDVFRYSLQSGKKKLVTIREEMQVVRNYLEIEKLRFSERLNYSFQIDEKCLNFAIPPLILQTLVENSVKHGISPKIEGGEVMISIQNQSGMIEIKIEDNGVGMLSEQEGFGLDAVKNILKLQFANSRFALKNENGVKIKILIPKWEITNEI
ncbi:MAG TPA: histidine kinase [Candidatus Cloacimonadota bacterium]|nr:histidine kinase [Candidatus Cloacimonadota bacterium]